MKKITMLFLFLFGAWLSYGQEVTIGTGTLSERWPFGATWGYERSAALYTAEEIGQVGFINKLAWNLGGISASKPVKIYLKEVETSTLTAGNWASFIADATLVYDDVMAPTSIGFFTFDLNSSFAYTGGTKNLLVLVETNYGGTGGGGSFSVRGTAAAGKHYEIHQDHSAPTGNLAEASGAFRPNLRIVFGNEITCQRTRPIDVTVGSTEVAFNLSLVNAFYYELRTSGEAGSGATGLHTSATVNDPTSLPMTISGLSPNTSYSLYVRNICGEDKMSEFSNAYRFVTSLIPNTLPYVENFEGETSFAFLQDTTNKWYVGTAVQNGGTRSLYISNNDGVANQYTNSTSQVSHAYSDFAIPANTTELSIKFDWRCAGELTAWDRFRVWAVPSNYIPTVGTQISTGSGRVQLGRENYNGNTVFLQENLIINASAFAGQTMRLVFEWRNDGSGGDNPPAAIDNLNISVISCSQPRNLALEAVGTNTLTVNWSAIAGVTDYEVYISTDATEPDDSATVVDVTGTTHTFNGLNPNTQYYVWVRSKCSETDVSFWSGPLNALTSLVSVALPYADDFETDRQYGIINDNRNKWHIGNAVSNGGNRSLYVSNDEGVTNLYSNNTVQTSHIYKDFTIPTGTSDIEITFDWRCIGESSWDYFRVWAVPTTYVPRVGVQATVANSGGVRLGREYFNLNTGFSGERLVFNASAYAGQTMRLVFEWRNDGSGGDNPPAAIDNLSVKVVTCPTVNRNTITIGSITRNSAVVSWTGVTGISAYDVYHNVTGVRPNETTTPTATVNATTYTLNGLEDGTQYYVWVRSHCSSTDTGYWEGPILFGTELIPVNLPYFEDFVDNPKFGYVNDTNNKWFTGQADNINGGAIYISNNNGVSNSYNVSGTQTSHIYKDIIFPAQSDGFILSFNWRAVGESTWDFFKVWLVPTSYMPVAGTQTTVANSGGVQLGQTLYNQSGSFTNERILLDGNAYAGQTMRLIFEWKQDVSGGNQPPAAIKNLYIRDKGCPEVENIEIERIDDTNQFNISWTPIGQETKWEVLITTLDDDDPIYTSTGVIVEGTPEYTFTEAEEEVFYRVYVRPICSDTDKGFWAGPGQFSIFHPPGCASISLEDLELEVSEDGNYYLCSDDPVTLNLKANYYDIKATTAYEIESIDYDPPFPFVGGDAISLTQDDYWSEIIELGFDFCFFGNNYNKVLIGTNGMITFSILNEVEGGRYGASQPSGYSYGPGPTHEIPINRPSNTSPPYVNSISGVLQDMLPSNSPTDHSVNYQILGTAPCRALVFNMYHMGLFSGTSCPYDPNDIEGTTTTTQIVLYEGTNIIEVYVKNRKACTNFNNGSGLIGIQNADGTIGYAPPGRNTGAWDAQNEAWRFVPNGASIANFQWLRDGEFYSDETDITVTIEESTTFTGKISYTHCNGNKLEIKKNFKFLKEPFELAEPKTLYDCAKKPDSDYFYNLDDNIQPVMQGLNLEEYTIEYFLSKADLDAGENPIDPAFVTKVPGETLIYMKVTNKLTKCPKDVVFHLGIRDQLGATKPKNIFVCKEVVLPSLAEGEAYYTEHFGQGTHYVSGDLYNVVGKNTLYVYHEDENGCYGESEFTIEILPEVFSPVFEDQIFSCEAYKLPELPKGSKYYTQPNEGGIELPVDYEVIVPMTIYIVTRNGNKEVYCYDEISFSVDFEECPIPKGISPNGDGLNESFDLSNHGIAKIQIFNRNGVEVYSHGEGYKKEWFGQNNSNKLLPVGTYYYVVVSNGKVRTGWVQLNY